MGTSREKIEKIAGAQKLLLWAILAAIIVNLGGIGVRQSLATNPVEPAAALTITLTIAVLQLAILVLQIVAVVRLCLALEEGWATAIYVILQCIPCLNLILLLFLNGRATTRLKAAGIRVGLMGANASDVANYQSSSGRKCPACGEAVDADATVCPMCGKEIARLI